MPNIDPIIEPWLTGWRAERQCSSAVREQSWQPWTQNCGHSFPVWNPRNIPWNVSWKFVIKIDIRKWNEGGNYVERVELACSSSSQVDRSYYHLQAKLTFSGPAAMILWHAADSNFEDLVISWNPKPTYSGFVDLSQGDFKSPSEVDYLERVHATGLPREF